MIVSYGNQPMSFDDMGIEFDQVLVGSEHEPVTDSDMDQVLEAAINTKSLSSLLLEKTPKSVAIIVEDQTRKNPEYPQLLEVIIKKIHLEGIKDIRIVIAYGTHNKHDNDVNDRLYGKANIEQATLVHHDARNQDGLIKIGDYKGCLFYINKAVAEADFVIVTGSVKPHAFAGFTGGRKAILPGVADYNSIRNNHAHVVSDKAVMGQLQGNPIHEGMMALASKVQVDYAIQMVKDNKGQLNSIYTGDLISSFERAVNLSRKLCQTILNKQTDIVVVSIGGAPKDKTLYQSQRAITTAVKAVKDNGLVFVIGELPGGVGNDLYAEWLSKPYKEVLNLSMEQIDIGIHSAYLTAKNYRDCQSIYLYSGQSKQWTEKYQFKYLKNIEEIHSIAKASFGKGYSSTFIPYGSDLMLEVDHGEE